MRVSAVILSFNSGQLLDRAVRSLAADLAAVEEPDEIWVVDNGSTDDSREVLRHLSEELSGLVKPIYLDRNLGTTVPRNLALGQTSGRFILVMDSDVEVPKGTVEHLTEVCRTDPALGIVVPEVRYPSGRLQLSTDRFPTVGRKLQRLVALRSLEEALQESPVAQRVDYAISAFWLFRRQLLESVGNFDERIFYSPEDVDYCLRVWKSGHYVYFDPAVHVIHHAQELSRGWRSPRFAISHFLGLVYLFGKHRYLFSPPDHRSRTQLAQRG
jgi:GT2 family glycosyltransferase